MRSVLEEALECMRGVVDTERGPCGVDLHRAPLRLRRQLADEAFDAASGGTSGVRLVTFTDAPVLEIEADVVRTVIDGAEHPNSAFDLLVDGTVRAPVMVPHETRVRINPLTGDSVVDTAPPAIVRFELGEPGARREVEIWFPSGARPRLKDVRISADATLERSPERGARWAHHGSSISHCGDVETPLQTWPAIVARDAGLSLTNLALAGQCHLDQGMARTIGTLGADVITLEVGINIVAGATMRERTFVSALHAFLDTVREGAPETRIVVASPIFCGALETQVGPLARDAAGLFGAVEVPAASRGGALTLTAARQLIHRVVHQRRADGDLRLEYLDGLELFGSGDAAALYDGLHPTIDGYRRIAERFRALVF